jgi:hypothetical protein
VQDGYMDFNLKKGFTWSGIFTQICKKLKHLNLNFTLNDCVFPFQNIGLHKALGQNTTDTDQADTEITLLCNSSQFHSSKSTQTSQIWCTDSTLILKKGNRRSELTMVSLETYSSLLLCIFLCKEPSLDEDCQTYLQEKCGNNCHWKIIAFYVRPEV